MHMQCLLSCMCSDAGAGDRVCWYFVQQNMRKLAPPQTEQVQNFQWGRYKLYNSLQASDLLCSIFDILAYLRVFELQQFLKLTSSFSEAILFHRRLRTKSKDNFIYIFFKLKAEKMVKDLKDGYHILHLLELIRPGFYWYFSWVKYKHYIMRQFYRQDTDNELISNRGRFRNLLW